MTATENLRVSPPDPSAGGHGTAHQQAQGGSAAGPETDPAILHDELRYFCDFLARGRKAYFWRWCPGEGLLLIAARAEWLDNASRCKALPNWEALVSPEDCVLVAEALRRSKPQTPEHALVLRVRSSDNRWRSVEWTSQVLQWDGEGQPRVLCGILRDVQGGQGKQDEAGVLVSRANAAERASHEKNLFLGNLSHEIRTPINAILGLATLTGATHLSREQAEYMRLIKTSAESVAAILSNVLDFSRIEAGGLELEHAPFSVRRLLSDTLRALAFPAQQKGLEITLNIDREVPDSLNGDATRIKQIVTNLFQNAVKFTERGDVALTVSVTSDAGDQTRLALAVTDTGCGIPQHVQRKIFEAYEQADSSIVRQYGGFGLGLSISRRLAQLMGGGLEVRSEPGEGAIFTAHVVCRREPEGMVAPPVLEGKRVLVIESNHRQRGALAEVLEELGGRPVLVESVAAGMGAIVNSPPFEWVLISAADLQRESGWDIHGFRAHAATRVILLAGVNPHAEEFAKQHPRSIDGTLLKPFSSLDMREAIAAIHSPVELSPPILDEAFADQLSSLGKRILIAEDNPVSRRVTAVLLEKAGYKVTTVADGQEAMDALEASRFAIDAVLMDLQMPRMDGIATTEAIRMHEMRRSWVMDFGWRQIPVIGLTGDAAPEARRRCVSSGMNDVLIKPVKPEVLLASLAKALKAPDDSGPAIAEVGRLLEAQVEKPLPVPPRESPPADRGVIDLEAARTWLGGDAASIARMAEDFFAGLTSVTHALREATAQKDIPAFCQTLDKLRASLNKIGAFAAMDAAVECETALRGQGVGALADAYGCMMDQLNRVSGALRQATGNLQAKE